MSPTTREPRARRAALLAQTERLLRAHPYIGADPVALMEVLLRGERLSPAEGAALCREGDAGDRMFVLLRGQVEILKRDRQGRDRSLVTLQAPALLGHMSLADRAPRSATCVARAASELVVIDARLHRALFDDPSAQGTAWRRLLISSLNQQMIAGVEQLEGMLRGGEGPGGEGDVSDEDVLQLAGAVAGWQFDASGEEEVRFGVDEDARRNQRKRRW